MKTRGCVTPLAKRPFEKDLMIIRDRDTRCRNVTIALLALLALLALYACNSAELAKISGATGEDRATASATHSEVLARPEPTKAAGLTLCERLCAHTAPLACSAHADCSASCVEMGTSAEACAPKLDTFMRCLVSRPLSDFECDDDGIASVKDGPCDVEQGAVAQCLVSTPSER